MKKKKKILLIIGGGVSAYKSLDLIRLLKKNNFQIKTVLTNGGKQFVTPLSLVSLSGGKVYNELFNSTTESEIDHISLSRWADLIIVVPATANLISKLSLGKAEDLATTIVLASNKDVFIVPAMNVRMWENKATVENCKTLYGYGYKFIGPLDGFMACGEFGKGKMVSPRIIFREIFKYFSNRDIVKKRKYKALVTTGATREYIDPIRFLSNESSGKQGHEIAEALNKRGVKTTLIAGPSNIHPSKNINVIKIKTSDEMFKAVKKALPVDIAVCAAAVADFKPSKYYRDKLKKKDSSDNIKVNRTVDILEYLGKNNLNRPKLVIGFSAETKDALKNSKDKLKNKNSDLIISNDVSKIGVGFNSDFNEVTILESNGKSLKIKKSKKSYIASIIAERIINKLLVNDKNLN